MKKLLIIMLSAIVVLPGCAAKYNTTKVIKPKKHLFAYNPKWHKKFKRVHKVKVIR